jgi:catechol 2,3-dioxygenase-like lactoylglutathione lyase family enzyme
MIINSIHPVLSTKNVQASLDFYTNILGKADTYFPGEKSEYGLIKLGSYSIHFAKVDIVTIAQRHSLMIFVDDVDAYYERCKIFKVEIVKELRNEPYSLRDFVFKDNNGHKIVIAKKIKTK